MIPTIEKIEKMVAKYNKYATKHGYETISVDFENKKVIGTFTPKDENQGKGFSGFFKDIITGGWNGYFKEDYEKIVESLEKYEDNH